MAGAAEARSFSFLQIAEQIVWMEPGQKDSNKFERIKTPEAYNVLTGRRNYYEEKIYLNDPTRQILFVLIPYGTTFMIDDVIYYKLDEAREESEAEPKEPVKPRKYSFYDIEWGDWPYTIELSSWHKDVLTNANELDHLEVQEDYRRDLIKKEFRVEKWIFTKEEKERIEEIVRDKTEKAKELIKKKDEERREEQKRRDEWIREEKEERKRQAEEGRRRAEEWRRQVEEARRKERREEAKASQSKQPRSFEAKIAQSFDGFHIV